MPGAGRPDHRDHMSVRIAATFGIPPQHRTTRPTPIPSDRYPPDEVTR
jgi:hypothetical protein